MIGIYKITNLINGKMYIGKSNNIERRKREHKNMEGKSVIHDAIRKYGNENFSFEVVEECPLEKLNEREIYWIKYFNTFLGEGYNCTPGGDGFIHPVKVSDEQLKQIINDLINHTNLSIVDIAKKYNVSASTISFINLGKSRPQDGLQYPLRENPFDKREIPSKDLLLKEISETCGNFYDIAKKFEVSYQTVRNWCQHHNLSTNKKDYGYVNDQSYHSTFIEQIDVKTKEVICSFNSINEAGRILKLNPKAIGKALDSRSHFSQGYLWKRKENKNKKY